MGQYVLTLRNEQSIPASKYKLSLVDGFCIWESYVLLISDFLNFCVMNDAEFLQLIKKQDFFDVVRFYFICKNKHYFINNGHTTPGFSSKIIVTKNRDNVLSAFSKMGFLFDEIIRMRIAEHGKNRDEILYVLNLIPLNRKIRTFLD